MRRRWLPLLAVAAAAVIGACTDSFDDGNACPALCPEQVVEVKDTVLDAIVLDSTVLGYPPVGSEIFLLLASRGDTVDSRVVLRFDTLPQRFTRGGADSAIYELVDAGLTLVIDTASAMFTAPVTLEAYDVDSPAPDTAFGALVPLFTPSRGLGAVTLLRPGLSDTVRVPLAPDRVLARLTGPAPRRLRIGLRLTSTEPAQLRVRSQESGATPYISYDPSPDPVVPALVQGVVSLSPPELPEIATELADFTLLVAGDPPAPASVLRVGGLPSGRVFLRFDAPKNITDSSDVLRATLLLTQLPSRRVDAGDSLTVFSLAVKAPPEVTDVVKATAFIGNPLSAIDAGQTRRLLPSDSGEVSIDVVSLVSRWRVFDEAPSQRAIVLAMSEEGQVPGSILFASTEAAAALRPKLRISYVTRINLGRP